MKERLQQWIARIDELSLRERGLILAGALAIVWALWDLLLMQPLLDKQDRAQARIEQLQGEIRNLDEAARNLVEQSARDPRRQLEAEIARLNAELTTLEQDVEGRRQDLVDPRQMAQLLEQVLTRDTDLRLRSLRSLDAEPLLDGDSQLETPLYRHGVEIEFSGSYLGTLAYLEALEELPWRFFWDSVELEVENHPRTRVRIVVFTLGTREGLLGV